METWLLTIAEKQKYLGNEGYANDARGHYSYDSKVPNCKALTEGDTAIVREGKFLTGISIIESITAKEGIKKITRCPVCLASRLRFRTTMTPSWKCDKGHEFDKPKYLERPVTRYTAKFGSKYRRLSGEADWHAIKPYFQTATVQSIRKIRQIDLMKSADPRLSDLRRHLDSLAGATKDQADMEVEIDHAKSALAALQSFLEGCRSEDDESVQSSNKLALPLPESLFEQLKSEITYAQSALDEPVPTTDVLTQTTLFMRGVHNFWDGLTTKAGESIGSAAGKALLIGTGGIVAKFTGLLDAAINALQALI